MDSKNIKKEEDSITPIIKDNESLANFNMNDGFIPQVCEMRCRVFDEQLRFLREKINSQEKEFYEEIEDMAKRIESSIDDKNDNIKDKIVLVEKSIGKKIDYLNDFDSSLKGNGKPGVWETIRSIQVTQKYIITALVFIIILQLGGNFRGISWDSIRRSVLPPTFSERAEESEYEKGYQKGYEEGLYEKYEEVRNGNKGF